jgi:hypothetical protein
MTMKGNGATPDAQPHHSTDNSRNNATEEKIEKGQRVGNGAMNGAHGPGAESAAAMLAEAMALFHPNGHWPLVAIKRVDNVDVFLAKDFLPSPTRAADAARWAKERVAEGFGVYFAVNPLKRALGAKASKDNVAAAWWLWTDSDPLDCWTAEEKEEWRRSKIAELRSGGPLGIPATLILDSGRGVWGFWRLADGVPLDGRFGPNTSKVEGCGKALENAFDADACRNVDRVARLPGFLNVKAGRTASIVEYHPERVYRIEDFPCVQGWTKDGSGFDDTTYGEFIDDDEAVRAFSDFLTNAPPAIEGTGKYIGRTRTRDFLNRGMDLGLRPTRRRPLWRSMNGTSGANRPGATARSRTICAACAIRGVTRLASIILPSPGRGGRRSRSPSPNRTGKSPTTIATTIGTPKRLTGLKRPMGLPGQRRRKMALRTMRGRRKRSGRTRSSIRGRNSPSQSFRSRSCRWTLRLSSKRTAFSLAATLRPWRCARYQRSPGPSITASG